METILYRLCLVALIVFLAAITPWGVPNSSAGIAATENIFHKFFIIIVFVTLLSTIRAPEGAEEELEEIVSNIEAAEEE